VVHGLYSVKEVFVAGSAAVSALGFNEWQTAFRASQFRVGEACRACATVAAVQVQVVLQHGPAHAVFFRFDASARAVDKAPALCAAQANGRVTADAPRTGAACPFECDAGFHAINWRCVLRDLLRRRDGAFFPPAAFTFLSEECDYESRASTAFVWRNTSSAPGGAACVLCNASACPVGRNLAGANCNKSRACEQIALVNGGFTSHGDLDRPGSCAEECALGFFADFERCETHSLVTCAPSEYELAGTAQYDVMYLPCADCRGRRMLSPCQARRDATCKSCAALVAHEQFADTNCSAVCVAAQRGGRVRDVRARVRAGHLPRLRRLAQVRAVRRVAAPARPQLFRRGVRVRVRARAHARSGRRGQQRAVHARGAQRRAGRPGARARAVRRLRVPRERERVPAVCCARHRASGRGKLWRALAIDALDRARHRAVRV